VVWEEQWRRGQDVVIRSNDISHATRKILTEYSHEVFVNYVGSKGENLHLERFSTVPFWDNFQSYIDRDILMLVASNNIIRMIFPPHISNSFQLFDLVASCILEHEKDEMDVRLPEQ
jgi:hypothetical protein